MTGGPSRERELAGLEDLLAHVEVESVRSGEPFPLGARPRGHGVNFAVFSRHATGVRLDLFARPEDTSPERSFILDASRNKTGDIWHVWLAGVRSGQLYGYRVAGPYAPRQGHRFNPNKLLLDPYATAIAVAPGGDLRRAVGYDPASAQKDLSFSDVDDAADVPKCVVAHPEFDWQGDQPLRTPGTETVIYELHVRGFTIDPGSGVGHPGTYRGLVEKIPYLKDLGVTAVELMPVTEFDERLISRHDPRTGQPLRNYWGYDPLGFFAPKASYAGAIDHGTQVREFKEMVRAFHRAGLEVILDVVLNHTVEGSELGPTVSLRGIDNAIYYWLDTDRRFYRDFTGTGHTINASHPIVRDLILDALRFWVIEMHVDGFRFDLASVLGRDASGQVVADAPLLERIAEDAILRDTKLIAEAWDVAGAYQIGTFSQRRWAEWNGRFRDDVRRFWRGDEGMMGRFASRICGSSDVYAASGKGPLCSVNFVTCHDGFTLNDLVSYERKHNLANGEDNRDGRDDNYGDNYGHEGPSDDPAIDAVRVRQIKNFLLTLAVSRGIPMLLGGDEMRRTQGGNNNAYCQDDETSWLDWSLRQRHDDVFRFTRAVLAIRREHAVLRRDAFYTDADVVWFGPGGARPAWDDPAEKRLGCVLRDETGDVCLLFNASTEATRFVLPEGPWSCAIDTARPDSPSTGQAAYELAPRASAILLRST
jgi:glycogen operon protein